jgi:hypothetical protein
MQPRKIVTFVFTGAMTRHHGPMLEFPSFEDYWLEQPTTVRALMHVISRDLLHAFSSGLEVARGQLRKAVLSVPCSLSLRVTIRANNGIHRYTSGQKPFLEGETRKTLSLFEESRSTPAVQ